MKEFVKKYEIWVFLVLGPFVNIFFVQARIEGLVSASIYNTGRFCVLFFVLACILKYTRGNKGILELFKPMTKWKIHPKWYLLSLTFALVISMTTLIIKALYKDVSLDTFITFKSASLRAYIAYMIWAFMGEVVWVSYCIKELSKKIKPFIAGQIIAIFWTLWFIPIILLGEGILPKIPLLSAYIAMMAIAGMCTFVYTKTKSGLCVFVLQAMLNLNLVSFPISPTYGGAPTYTAFAVIYLIAMLSLWGIDFLLTNRKSKILIQNP
ncbi:MAG: hypothetical protein ACWA5P_09215 [bacterium]